MKIMDDVRPHLEALCEFGLQCTVEDLSSSQQAIQARFIYSAGLHHEPIKEFRQALRYGMIELWPINQAGVFDARDVARHYMKARAVASKLRNAGRIPVE